MDRAGGRLERRHDVDWLRVLAMLTVFLFHCARFFNEEDWHVKNNQTSFGMTVFVEVLNQWIMPLFFVLSGISSYYALSYLKKAEYISARIKRLAIPLVVGIFTHISLQVYFERVSHGQFSGSYIRFFPRYFDGFYAFGGNFAWMGFHLWYLEMLFIFSLLMLPIFLWLRKESIRRVISNMAVFLKKPGAVFLLAVPILIIEWLVNTQPNTIGLRVWGGWSIFTHLVFFMLGYLLASDPQIKSAINKHRIGAMAMAVLATVLGYFLLQAGASSRGFFFSILRAFNTWFWLVAILGFGNTYLDINHRALKYANEAVLPFYILHQTVIVTIAFYIANWSTGIMTKYVFLSASAFIAIMALYDLAIKRVNILRFLFGMKIKRLEPDQPKAATEKISLEKT